MDIDEHSYNYEQLDKLLYKFLSSRKKYKNTPPKDSLIIYDNKQLCFEKGELIVLASRPSIGKTTLALNWMYDFASNQNKPVGFITSGIPDSEYLTMRILALASKINPAKLRCGLLNKNDTEQIEKAASKLSNLPIFISDIPNVKFEDVETVAAEMMRKNKIEILFIDGFDYLYEIAVSKSFCENAQWEEQIEPYYNEIYFMMENLKGFANKLQIPIVLLVPIKQDAYEDEPTIKSFEDKLIIPRIADKVIFLHRERINNDGEWQDAKLIVAKNSNGPCGDVIIRFYCKTVEFKYDEKEEN